MAEGLGMRVWDSGSRDSLKNTALRALARMKFAKPSEVAIPLRHQRQCRLFHSGKSECAGLKNFRGQHSSLKP